MLSQNNGPIMPIDPKRDPAMLKILRWLMADTNRILPPPDDDTGIRELAQAIGRSSEQTRALMAWSYGIRPGGETCQLLKFEGN